MAKKSKVSATVQAIRDHICDMTADLHPNQQVAVFEAVAEDVRALLEAARRQVEEEKGT